MSIICTLYEGNYHCGLAALVNSLYTHGFRGKFIAGTRDPLPYWASQARRNGHGSILDLGEGCSVHFLPVTIPWHFNNYKPHFILDLLQQHPDEDRFFFFDPDIVVKVEWRFFEEWIGHGIALCEDINHYLPATHPTRMAWKKYARGLGYTVRQETDKFFNGGFFGFTRPHAEFLQTWVELFAHVQKDGADLKKFGFREHGYPYLFADQDLLNLALMLGNAPLTVIGPEGMDFEPGASVMSHSAGDAKTWQKNFLKEILCGRAPTRTDKEFLKYTQSPIQLYTPRQLRWRRAELRIGAALGRFYRRN